MSEDLSSNIKRGDFQEIAEIAGCHKEYVRMVLKGKRAANSDLAKDVLYIAQKLADNRAQLQNLKRK